MKETTRRKSITVIRIILSLLFIISGSLTMDKTLWVMGADDGLPVYFTPDSVLNRQLSQGRVDPQQIFGVYNTKDGLVINPKLRKGWTWLAVRNMPFQGEKITFFLHDGWLYTDKSIHTSFRRMKFSRDVSALIHSNVFSVAFYKEKGIEKELVIFIASEREIDARIIIDSQLWGEEKEVSYNLKAGEGHFISILKMPEEFKPYFLPAKSAERKYINLDKEWRFIRKDVQNACRKNFRDETWKIVNLPHSWNAEDVFDTRNIFDGYDIFHEYYRGKAWYRKRFTLDPAYRGKSIEIRFEGANQVARVWLNGKYLGEHVGGYTGFSFDISNLVKFGNRQNILAVQVDNSFDYEIPPHTADYNMYGGLYRDVFLEVKERLYIKSLNITTPEISSTKAIAKVETVIRNDFPEEKEFIQLTNIADINGEIVSSRRARLTLKPNSEVGVKQTMPEIDNPRLWSPADPYLYSVYSTIYVNGNPVDEIRTSYGFRWYEFNAERGFSLNGRELKLRGVNKHQDYIGLGNAVPDSLQIRDIEIIKEMGANFIRLAHYPQDPAVLDACDRVGLLVWEEIPVVNSVGGEEFSKNACRMLKEMIHRDRNHPSIILWGISNESIMRFAREEDVKRVKGLLMKLHGIAKKEDPTRLTVQAHNHLKDESIADITDVIGRNRYYGWYEGTMEDFEKAMVEEHSKHPGWKIIISEYGVGSKRGLHVDNPRPWDFSEEYQLAFHRYYLEVINKYPWIAGGAIWNAFDFGSSVKKGNVPRINQKGVCDFSRKPKDVYYFYQSQWSDKPMVYILSHTRKSLSGKMNASVEIKVFSNCDSVELFINGKSMGSKSREEGFAWKIRLPEGENSVVAVGEKMGIFVEDSLDLFYTTTGEE